MLYVRFTAPPVGSPEPEKPVINEITSQTESVQTESVETSVVESQAMPEALSETETKKDSPSEALIESFRAGNYRKVIEIFEGLSASEWSQMLPIAGIAYYKTGDINTARRLFEDSLRYKETFIALKYLAFIYYEIDDLQRSAQVAEKALAIKRDAELTVLIARLKRELSVQRDFVEERVLHFKVLYDGYEHGDLSRRVIEMLEDAYQKVGEALRYYPSEPITVILYTRESFFDTTRLPSWSGGLYDGKIRIPVASALKQPEALRRVITHEYAHAVIRRITKSLPTWLNEGLAEYLSGRGEKIGQAIPLRELEGSFFEFDEAKANTAYRVSYSAVAYLIERYGIYSVNELLRMLGEGNDLNSSFSKAFGISYDGFVSLWGR